jgi:hypothetical protein
MRYEDKEQEAVIQWAEMTHAPSVGGPMLSDYLVAIPNEGKRSGRTGNAMKRRGLRPGASDLFLAIPAGTMHGLWIEMKKQRQHFRSRSEAESAYSQDQRDFHDAMSRKGYATAVAYGAGEAIETIRTYLGLPHSRR